MAQAHVDKLTAECEWFCEGPEQANPQSDSLLTHICLLEVPLAIGYQELCDLRRAMPSLKDSVEAGKERANTAELWACMTLKKISELLALLERINSTIAGQHVRVSEPVDAELQFILSIITEAPSESEGTVSKGISGVSKGFSVKA